MSWSNRFLIFVAYGIAVLSFSHRGGAQPEVPPLPVIQGPGSCETCHAKLEEDRLTSPTKHLEYDRHARAGLGCADCHGGDPKALEANEAHSLTAGYIGVPEPGGIPPLCAACHANPEYMITQNPQLPVDQYEKYWTSRHGELLQMGLRKVATCSSCHTAHNVRLASDPLSSIYPANIPYTCGGCHASPSYMAGFPIPTDQLAKYAASVHGKALLEKEDLGAPACNDCHGNHGAIPPGAESLSHVCGLCHALNADLFAKSPHADVFAIQELPQCAVCHGHHAIAAPSAEMFAMGADSPCIECHHPDDEGWDTGKEMYATVEGVKQVRSEAETVLDKAQNLGMDVSDARFLLQDFRKNVLQLRTLSHELDLKQYKEKAKEARGQAETALEMAKSAIGEYHYRRKGLAVSLLLSLPVIALLFLKIRSLNRQEPRG